MSSRRHVDIFTSVFVQVQVDSVAIPMCISFCQLVHIVVHLLSLFLTCSYTQANPAGALVPSELEEEHCVRMTSFTKD